MTTESLGSNDPLAWDPLVMKFAEFFGGGPNVHGSRRAAASGSTMRHGRSR